MKKKASQLSHTVRNISPKTGAHRDYGAWVTGLKQRIRSAQIRAALSVNRELIQLYWDIGRDIVLKQEKEGWGATVIDRLSADLQREFPEMTGLSRSNIFRMRAFYVACRQSVAIVAQPVRQIEQSTNFVRPPIVAQPVRQLEMAGPPEPMASLPWGHNITLIETVPDPETRFFYARKALENGWSRNMLSHWIDSRLHEREGKAITNFKTALPPDKSDLALQILKDPYNFEFLTLSEEASEKDLETGLLEHITRFLLELGAGFAFVGRQARFEVDGKDYSIDLLFYHLHLRCFIVIDLKTGKFEPGFAGMINFHLSAVDDQMRTPADGPSIGLLLCKERSKIVVEYALRNLQRPIGVAGYNVALTDKLPRALAGKLPTVKDIQQELARATRKGRSPKSKKQNRRS